MHNSEYRPTVFCLRKVNNEASRGRVRLAVSLAGSLAPLRL